MLPYLPCCTFMLWWQRQICMACRFLECTIYVWLLYSFCNNTLYCCMPCVTMETGDNTPEGCVCGRGSRGHWGSTWWVTGLLRAEYASGLAVFSATVLLPGYLHIRKLFTFFFRVVRLSINVCFHTKQNLAFGLFTQLDEVIWNTSL